MADDVVKVFGSTHKSEMQLLERGDCGVVLAAVLESVYNLQLERFHNVCAMHSRQIVW